MAKSRSTKSSGSKSKKLLIWDRTNKGMLCGSNHGYPRWAVFYTRDKDRTTWVWEKKPQKDVSSKMWIPRSRRGRFACVADQGTGGRKGENWETSMKLIGWPLGQAHSGPTRCSGRACARET